MSVDPEITTELKRYLVRKSASGNQVVHRVGGTDSVVPSNRQAPLRDAKPSVRKVPAGESAGSKRQTKLAGEKESKRREEPARRAETKKPETKQSEPPVGGMRPKQREQPREESTSIQYRYESDDRSQGNLFADNSQSEGLDLSGLGLEALEKRVSTCTRCPLAEGRTNTVFGSGDPKSRIVFIGEAPGREEDLQGLPFVGRAGKLLTKILASVGFSREEVYITNILKCRPPENRDPREEESKACEPFLRRQLECIDPVLIVAMGRVAGINLLKRNASLSILRQGIHYYDDTKVIVMYHPAALLRNPSLKRDAREDIKRVREVYEEAFNE